MAAGSLIVTGAELAHLQTEINTAIASDRKRLDRIETRLGALEGPKTAEKPVKASKAGKTPKAEKPEKTEDVFTID